MPSCTAQDSINLLSLSTTLVAPSTAAVTVAAPPPNPWPGPPPIHDCGWCSRKAGGGAKCEGDECAFPNGGGKKRPCKHEKPAGRGVAKPAVAAKKATPAERKAAAKVSAKAKARDTARREVSAGLDKIAKALRRASTADALHEHESGMLEFVQAWKKSLDEAKPRRRPK